MMAKLGVYLAGQVPAAGSVRVEYVEVKGGLIRTGRLPRSRLFVWHNPAGEHDVVIFIGEAQPPIGKYAFCRRLIEFAKGLSVERVFTFAAMATDMRPEKPSRVFGAATDEETLSKLRQLEVEIVEEGAHRRAERRAARRRRRKRPARRLPAGRDAASFPAVAVPQGVAGGAGDVRHDGRA